MAEIVILPKTYSFTSSSENKNMYDGDDSTSYMPTSTATHLLSNFDVAALPSNAIVTGVSVYVCGFFTSSGGYVDIMLVKDATSTSAYTDLGDGAIRFIDGVRTKTAETKAFPVATSVCTTEFLKSGALQMRSYIRKGNGYPHIYDIYVVISYKMPSSTITVNASPTAGGTVTGDGEYENGTTATLTATPSTGYKFKQWSDGNTNATRTITVTTDATYTAQFEKLTFNVSAAVTPAEGGTVSGAGVYSYGDTATLTATPNEGYKFKQWSDGVTSESRSFTVTAAASFTAIFEKAATSNTFRGTSRQTAYRGTEKQAVYIGNKKI